MLVSMQAKLDCRDNLGRSIITHAAMHGQTDALRWLLDEGNTILDLLNSVDKLGSSALHWAAAKGPSDSAMLLISRGIDIHAKVPGNRTAEMLARKNGKERLAGQIKEYRKHGSEFMYTVATGYLSDLKKKQKQWRAWMKRNEGFGARFYRDKDGLTALHEAAKHGRLDIAKYLVNELHFCIVARDKCGRIPLHFAAMYGHRALALWLIRLPAAEPENSMRNMPSSSVESSPTRGARNVRHWQFVTGTNKSASVLADEGLQYGQHSDARLGKDLRRYEV